MNAQFRMLMMPAEPPVAAVNPMFAEVLPTVPVMLMHYERDQPRVVDSSMK